jgi:hypothetical protein
MIISESNWNKESKLLTTQISGVVGLDDVQRWQASLQTALGEIEDGGIFKIMINLHGFKAENFEVHKAFREIIPRTLADYGWHVGYLAMFPEASIELRNLRGIQCKAAVHIHQDETKIQNYDTNYSSPTERFFTDVLQAQAWIDSIHIAATKLDKSIDKDCHTSHM